MASVKLPNVSYIDTLDRVSKERYLAKKDRSALRPKIVPNQAQKKTLPVRALQPLRQASDCP